MNKVVVSVCAAVSLSLSAMPSIAQGTKLQRVACTGDVFRHCSEEIPNVERITECLRRQKPKLSAACQTVFNELDQTKVATRSVTPGSEDSAPWCALGENPEPGQEVWIAWCSQKTRAN